MLISYILLLLSSNAVTLRRDKSILYSRVLLLMLTYSFLILLNLNMTFSDKGIGLFGGLFQTTYPLILLSTLLNKILNKIREIIFSIFLSSTYFLVFKDIFVKEGFSSMIYHLAILMYYVIIDYAWCHRYNVIGFQCIYIILTILGIGNNFLFII